MTSMIYPAVVARRIYIYGLSCSKAIVRSQAMCEFQEHTESMYGDDVGRVRVLDINTSRLRCSMGRKRDARSCGRPCPSRLLGKVMYHG